MTLKIIKGQDIIKLYNYMRVSLHMLTNAFVRTFYSKGKNKNYDYIDLSTN